MKSKRPLGLVLIVGYKLLLAFILAITATCLILASDNPQSFIAFSDYYIFSDSYIWEEQLEGVERLEKKIININPKTLKVSGVVAGIYASATAIQAIGLWYKKAWARILVLGIVGISIPLELFELFRGVTLLKLVIFLGNVFVFWYLLRHFPKHGR